MSKYIVDASIVLKWVVSEEDPDDVYQIYSCIQKEVFVVFAPKLLLLEVINVCLKSKKLSFKVVQQVLKVILKSKIKFLEISPSEHLEIAKIASKYKLTSYDSCYVYLAKKAGVPLITFDKEILKNYKESLRPQDVIKQVGL